LRWRTDRIDLFWQKKVSLFQQDFTIPGLPFGADIMLISASFFLLGYFLKHRALKFKPGPMSVITALSVFISFHLFFDNRLDLNPRIYDGLVIPTLEALSGIYIILFLSYLIQYRVGIAHLMSRTGSASLFILIFHTFFHNKAFDFAVNHLGGANLTSAIFAFAVGSIIPVAIWFAVSRIDCLAMFYLPLKSNETYRRLRDGFVHKQAEANEITTNL
jgi:fucose 4-O-acetylase-like acetyltransferase